LAPAAIPVRTVPALSLADRVLLAEWTSLHPCGLRARIVAGQAEAGADVVAVYRHSPAQSLWFITPDPHGMMLLSRAEEADAAPLESLEAALGEIVHIEAEILPTIF
jgi:hypothetical protein